MGNSDFNKWLSDNNYTGTGSLRLKKQFLLEWLDSNSDNYEDMSDLSDALFDIMISLDMDQYVNSRYDSKNLLLYSGKADPYEHEYLGSIHTKVVEKVKKYEYKNDKYILANQSEIIDFVTEVINFSLGNEIPFDYEYSQPRLNNLCFSKAVEYLASGNVPAIIMNNTTPMSLPEVPIRQMFSFQNQHKPLA